MRHHVDVRRVKRELNQNTRIFDIYQPKWKLTLQNLDCGRSNGHRKITQFRTLTHQLGARQSQKFTNQWVGGGLFPKQG